MRSSGIALIVSLLAMGPALAQPDTIAAGSPLDTPIEQIAATSDGCAVLDKDFPGLRAHPMYGSFKRMSLNQIAAMSKGQITSEMMTQARADLSALPPAQSLPQEATPIIATPASAEP